MSRMENVQFVKNTERSIGNVVKRQGEVSVAYLPLTQRIYHDIYVFPSDTSDFNYVFLQA